MFSSNLINLFQTTRKFNTLDLKLGLLNIRSLAPKTISVNEIITNQNFDALCLTETWIRPDEFDGLNKANSTGYNYVHNPRINSRVGGTTTIYRMVLTRM